jgi:hypothetical protein
VERERPLDGRRLGAGGGKCKENGGGAPDAQGLIFNRGSLPTVSARNAGSVLASVERQVLSLIELRLLFVFNLSSEISVIFVAF